MHVPNPFTLPAIDFIGGSTQDLIFHCYFYVNKKPHDLSSCTANFAIINFVNKSGEPVFSKQMKVGTDQDGDICNVLSVTLDPDRTVNIPAGKYIYQISIRDISGDIEVNQGIIHIIGNIDKRFVSNEHL